MHQAPYKAQPSARPYRKTVARHVREHHSRKCALSQKSGKRCNCDPTYVAAIRTSARTHERSFGNLADAVSWAQQTRDAIRRGEAPTLPRDQAPPLADLAVSFLHRARRGDALTRSRQRYADATLNGYEIALRLRVLPHIEPRSGLALSDLAANEIDTRAAQSLVDAITARQSHARARAAAAALSAVLRDGYVRGLVDELPPRLLLPPPPPARTRALTPTEGERLLAAAYADDAIQQRSLLGPLVTLLLGSGARLSEALGLLWGEDGLDLDGAQPLMRIRRETTKTAAGARTVPLARDAAAALRRHRLANGRPADGTPVFADSDGRPLKRSGRVRYGVRRVSRAAELRALSAHVLRHTHATWLAAAGVPASTAAARLGHADGGALFMRVYAHPGGAEAQAALEALSAFHAAAAKGR